MHLSGKHNGGWDVRSILSPFTLSPPWEWLTKDANNGRSQESAGGGSREMGPASLHSLNLSDDFPLFGI